MPVFTEEEQNHEESKEHLIFYPATNMFLKSKQNFDSSTAIHINVLESSLDKNLSKIEERKGAHF
jgi:hypothetical protein